MPYTLYKHELLNHITNGMILRLGSIILQVVSAAYSTDAIHTRAMWSSYSVFATLQLSFKLTLYTPDSISRMIQSAFIDFVKQSAACVAVSIQSMRSPPPG